MTKNLSHGRGWLSDACADSVHRADSAFGRVLPITSAGRTRAEQAEAYRKYKNGGPLALPPGTSPHESGVCVDWGNAVYDLLGLRRGLGFNGAPINEFGFARDTPSEVWHTPYTQSRDKRATGSGGNGEQWPARALYGEPWVTAIQEKANRLGAKLDVDGKDGPATQAWVKSFQQSHGLNADGVAGPITNNKMDDLLTAASVGRNATQRPTVEVQLFLQRSGYDIGPFGADNDYGAGTTAAVMKYQSDKGLVADGIWGDATDAKAFPPAVVGRNDTTRSTWDIQRLVGANPDGEYGADTTAKVKTWQGANGLEADGIWGAQSDAKGFPATPVSEWPTSGRNATTRPTEEIQRLVGAEADGSYGPNTSVKVAQWQSANGLEVDGIWGPGSDARGFPGVALPDAPAEPEVDPLYGKKMPQYPDADWADVSPNKSVREGRVEFFVVHHAAATSSVAGLRKRFMTANDRNVSPNWLIGADGSVSEIVPPDDYRAWTTGAFDHKAVTVETQNTSGDPTWGISAESHDAIARLVAWAAARYEFPIDRAHVIGHREVPGQATACPGPSMDLNRIVELAKGYASSAPDPQPDTVPVERSWLQSVLDKLKTLLGGGAS